MTDANTTPIEPAPIADQLRVALAAHKAARGGDDKYIQAINDALDRVKLVTIDRDTVGRLAAPLSFPDLWVEVGGQIGLARKAYGDGDHNAAEDHLDAAIIALVVQSLALRGGGLT